MDPNTRPHLLFRCPHCPDEVVVGPSSVGGKVVCPTEGCGITFLAPLPEAECLGIASPEQTEAMKKGGTDATHEEVLLVVRPAMFRSRPASTVGLVLLLFAAGAAAVLLPLPFGIAGGAILLLVVLAVAGTWYLERMSTKLTVTNDRTTLVHGIFSREGNEVQHDDVRNLQVEQNVLERMMDVGRIKISSAGQGDVEIDAKHMPDPTDVAAIVRKYQ